ncbi:ABC transporter substrate-binding protein [Citreicella sp. C3M06]|uniref:ABC transporter substrate-binding protein n=1 Tax=Citreicella sp. C3M06 TaxID=2841564 RepID=UPI001C084D13|nr:ABC transporter substrate-binding protein [Citreicella sp. C3M06]MBU2961276.1 ABC transporter substrate-binding protein [Citreicella sp. C3M06]
MTDKLKNLRDTTALPGISRRGFLGTASAAAMTVAGANLMFAGKANAQEPVKGGTLKMGLGGGQSSDSLDPALAANSVTFHVLRTFGETLVDVSPDGSLDMRIAEEIESSPDAKTWRFKIRQGVEFHNGEMVTPEDVLATLERHSDEESQSGALGVMQGIESMSIDGDWLVVNLDTANADLPYLFSDYHLQIQPGGGRDNPADGIGAGAYKLVSHEAGVRYTFEKHENYWDDTRGHYDGVEFLIINDSTARMAALQSGQVHIANLVEPKVASLLSRAPNINVTNVASRGHYVFIMHCDTAPFDNKDLRLALKYAINRQEMVDKILQGYGTIGNDTPINAAYPLFSGKLAQRNYDIEKAAEHYKASGHDGSPIVLKVADGAFPGAVDAAALFQQSAAAAGIPLEIQRVPNDGYWSEVWNKEPFCASYWGGRPVQDQMYSTAYLSTADWNDTRFSNEAFDALLLEARAELDEEKRIGLYDQMAEILHDEGGVICPMFNDFVEGMSTKVQGWVADGGQDTMNGLAPHKTWLVG